MHWRRAGLVIAPALLAACSPPSDDGMAVAEAEAAPVSGAAPAASSAPRPSDPVPQRLLGAWVYSHEICDPDAEDGPNARPIRASIRFSDAGTYSMDVEGFPQSGTYRYEGGASPRIQLDGSLLNFNVEGDTLQNWSEGDAPYLCGKVFVREK